MANLSRTAVSAADAIIGACLKYLKEHFGDEKYASNFYQIADSAKKNEKQKDIDSASTKLRAAIQIDQALNAETPSAEKQLLCVIMIFHELKYNLDNYLALSGGDARAELFKYFELVDHHTGTYVPEIDPHNAVVSTKLIKLLTDKLRVLEKLKSHLENKSWGQMSALALLPDIDTIFFRMLHSMKCKSDIVALSRRINESKITASGFHKQLAQIDKRLDEILSVKDNTECTDKITQFLSDLMGNEIKVMPYMSIFVASMHADYTSELKSLVRNKMEFFVDPTFGSLFLIERLLNKENEMNIARVANGESPRADVKNGLSTFFQQRESQVLIEGLEKNMAEFIQKANAYSRNPKKKEILDKLLPKLEAVQARLMTLKEKQLFDGKYFQYFNADDLKKGLNELAEPNRKEMIAYLDSQFGHFFNNEERANLWGSESKEKLEYIKQTIEKRVSLQDVVFELFREVEIAFDDHVFLCAINNISAGETGELLENFRGHVVTVFNQINFTNDPGFVALLTRYDAMLAQAQEKAKSHAAVHGEKGVEKEKTGDESEPVRKIAIVEASSEIAIPTGTENKVSAASTDSTYLRRPAPADEPLARERQLKLHDFSEMSDPDKSMYINTNSDVLVAIEESDRERVLQLENQVSEREIEEFTEAVTEFLADAKKIAQQFSAMLSLNENEIPADSKNAFHQLKEAYMPYEKNIMIIESWVTINEALNKLDIAIQSAQQSKDKSPEIYVDLYKQISIIRGMLHSVKYDEEETQSTLKDNLLKKSEEKLNALENNCDRTLFFNVTGLAHGEYQGLDNQVRSDHSTKPLPRLVRALRYLVQCAEGFKVPKGINAPTRARLEKFAHGYIKQARELQSQYSKNCTHRGMLANINELQEQLAIIDSAEIIDGDEQLERKILALIPDRIKVKGFPPPKPQALYLAMNRAYQLVHEINDNKAILNEEQAKNYDTLKLKIPKAWMDFEGKLQEIVQYKGSSLDLVDNECKLYTLYHEAMEYVNDEKLPAWCKEVVREKYQNHMKNLISDAFFQNTGQNRGQFYEYIHERSENKWIAIKDKVKVPGKKTTQKDQKESIINKLQDNWNQYKKGEINLDALSNLVDQYIKVNHSTPGESARLKMGDVLNNFKAVLDNVEIPPKNEPSAAPRPMR